MANTNTLNNATMPVNMQAHKERAKTLPNRPSPNHPAKPNPMAIFSKIFQDSDDAFVVLDTTADTFRYCLEITRKSLTFREKTNDGVRKLIYQNDLDQLLYKEKVLPDTHKQQFWKRVAAIVQDIQKKQATIIVRPKEI